MLNNDRKIGFFKDTVHNPQYGLGSIQMPATVKPKWPDRGSYRT
jgi:hypothetical protein